MERLAETPELLDGPLADQATLAGNLRDLRRVNRFLGGTALTGRALDALLRAAPAATDDAATRDALAGAAAPPDARRITLLDVGTGAADIPVALLAAWRAAGRRLEVTAIDSRAEVIAAACLGSRLADTPDLHLQVADGRALPYADGAFDVVHASLVLHHLEPDAGVLLLREMRRVASLGVIVNDLSRGRLAWLGAWLLAHLATGNAYTRHDAPLSVRRAYTAPEAIELFARAGMRLTFESSGFLGHRWVLAARAR